MSVEAVVEAEEEEAIAGDGPAPVRLLRRAPTTAAAAAEDEATRRASAD